MLNNNAATLHNLPDGYVEPKEFTDEQRAIAGNKIFTEPITVYSKTCLDCGLEFPGKEDRECPLCGSDQSKDENPKVHTLRIYPDGYTEVV